MSFKASVEKSEAGEPKKLVVFNDFLSNAIMALKTVGSEPFSNLKRERWKTVLLKIYYILGLGQLDYLMLGEMVHFRSAIVNPETVLEATAVAPCILFIFGGSVKELVLYIYREELYSIMDELKEIFPVTAEDQKKYNVQKYITDLKRAAFVFIFFCVGFTTIFSLLPALNGFVDVLIFGKEYRKQMGYFVWYPFDTDPTPVYIVTYGLQMHGAYVAGIIFVGADLLMCAAVSQNCMHLHRMSDMIREYVPTGSNSVDLPFLQKLIKYHGKILDLNEKVNKIFSICILISFLTASTAICFIGFQVTSSSTVDAIKYSFFLGAELTQIAAISYYGNAIIEASFAVGDSVFEHNWINASEEYRKMLVYIIQRSSNPASIRAPTFPPTSYITFMKVMTMSYRFFALLRTMLNRTK